MTDEIELVNHTRLYKNVTKYLHRGEGTTPEVIEIKLNECIYILTFSFNWKFVDGSIWPDKFENTISDISVNTHSIKRNLNKAKKHWIYTSSSPTLNQSLVDELMYFLKEYYF